MALRGLGRKGTPLGIAAFVVAMVLARVVRERWGVWGMLALLALLAFGFFVVWPRWQERQRRR